MSDGECQGWNIFNFFFMIPSTELRGEMKPSNVKIIGEKKGFFRLTDARMLT